MKISPLPAALAFLAMLLSGTAPAFAHTSLRTSDPLRDTRVEALRKVTLEFTESVRFPVVIVTGPGGLRYEDGKPQVRGPRVLQDVGPQLPGGAYTIAYRVVSRDGHPIEGEIPFRLVPPPSPGETPAAPVAAAPSASAEAGVEASVEASPEAQVAESPSVPGWVWVVVFGLAGIGIGMAFSMRKKP
ncbi:copper resistance protein CopC [Acrocarpospora macrocephala]|uniref:Copper resistance protein C n=1 Tax=Acrocarpospora macrocephala TaxID=150177 RepID=A0A5M3WQ01_9ACTN|nr:copper resistance CopC family protein [Acrocarpospora macrocephala]GES10630.1 copper resistance protein C [Acrocarpospora macrocephala]